MNPTTPNSKQRRHRVLLELIARLPIGSQEELADLLRERGFDVTQATVSRDIAELGLVKVPRGTRHVYAGPEAAFGGNAHDFRLARLLEDIPVKIGRSGLTLVLVATPGSAGAVAQAIDQSSLDDQVGTLAGDNTLLVLFQTESALERWLDRFRAYLPAAAPPSEDADDDADAADAAPPTNPAAAGTTASGRTLAHTEAPR